MSLACGATMLWSVLFGVLFGVTFLTRGMIMEVFWRALRVSSGGGWSPAPFVFAGLDNSGKTTMLHMLRHDKLFLSSPTGRPPQNEELMINGKMVRVYDYGGIYWTRRVPVWDFHSMEGMVFFIDAADLNRLGEARDMLDHFTFVLPKHMPLLILGTKIDLKGAISETELCLMISSAWIVACQGLILNALCSPSSSCVCRCCSSSDADKSNSVSWK